ncbi:MAG TPA: hypothetical protein VHW72_22200 [Candidatus Angelobacter sp.]|jgi:hypothetical protein|nr:hypothetical protein [Candidatus Angelobacter sp.]
MRTIPDQLKSRNLVPFKKRNGRYNIPGMTSEHEVLMDRVDADLSPEEQGFIRHYLGYADAFLRSVEHIVPEPLEGPVAQNVAQNEVAQNGSGEVTEQPAQAKESPAIKAA